MENFGLGLSKIMDEKVEPRERHQSLQLESKGDKHGK